MDERYERIKAAHPEAWAEVERILFPDEDIIRARDAEIERLRAEIGRLCVENCAEAERADLAETVIEAVRASLTEWEPKSTIDPMARIYRAMQVYDKEHSDDHDV